MIPNINKKSYPDFLNSDVAKQIALVDSTMSIATVMQIFTILAGFAQAMIQRNIDKLKMDNPLLSTDELAKAAIDQYLPDNALTPPQCSAVIGMWGMVGVLASYHDLEIWQSQLDDIIQGKYADQTQKAIAGFRGTAILRMKRGIVQSYWDTLTFYIPAAPEPYDYNTAVKLDKELKEKVRDAARSLGYPEADITAPQVQFVTGHGIQLYNNGGLYFPVETDVLKAFGLPIAADQS